MEITLNINENISAQQAARITELGNLAEEGVLVKQDFQSATRLYMLAAKAGDPKAFYHMGRACRDGRGVAQDTAKAKLYFKQGANFGDTDSIVAIGSIYKDEGDTSQAAYCFKLAADTGNLDGILGYAELLEAAGGDTKEFAELYRKAAGLGSADAAEALGRIYEDKTNPEYSPDIAVFWYRQAVNLGNAAAQAQIVRLEQSTEKDIDVNIEYDDDI
jgi:TPR repeat protein